eukprot:CAMPEP_0173349864 /NCGR_PEP_ID=MMETSP1144-20121109/14557_1 /TAXON_ID=483371 /ORGANISM="non described non described, Strain CCMP2298" /LENGTH=179 /DNA_ID=CAMNT_0014297731 /DNA_START=376 /DNA_END=912 /DNA_ORIENTATION=+
MDCSTAAATAAAAYASATTSASNAESLSAAAAASATAAVGGRCSSLSAKHEADLRPSTIRRDTPRRGKDKHGTACAAAASAKPINSAGGMSLATQTTAACPLSTSRITPLYPTTTSLPIRAPCALHLPSFAITSSFSSAFPKLTRAVRALDTAFAAFFQPPLTGCLLAVGRLPRLGALM